MCREGRSHDPYWEGVMAGVLGRAESLQVCCVRNYDRYIRKGGVIPYVLEVGRVMSDVLWGKEL